QLHKAIASTDYVPRGREISAIRILNNAFLDWRRGAITLHNVSDARIVGNYFSPPLTNNGLTAITNHVTADLWACDYSSIYFGNNVKGGPPADARSVRADGVFTNVPNAFGVLKAPKLGISATTDAVSIGWTSAAPAFVLQQAGAMSGAPEWMDL